MTTFDEARERLRHWWTFTHPGSTGNVCWPIIDARIAELAASTPSYPREATS